MKFFYPILIILSAFFLQGTILGRWPSFFILPNLMIVSLVFICLFFDRKESLLAGLFGGILMDFFSGFPFGITVASFLIIVLILGEAKFYLFARMNSIVSLLSAISVTFLYYLIMFSFAGILYFLRLSLIFIPKDIFLSTMTREILGNAIIASVFYLIIKIAKRQKYFLNVKNGLRPNF